ncbi:hypothetical protein [Paenibacillus validus]|uniref:hypothetical protein n=1 Tax=Paenibacillus validus TaxID=44253 RepID=UPI003D2A59D1
MQALNTMIEAMMQLSKEWDRIESIYSDEISEYYPFDSGFVEITRRVIEWRNQIKEETSKW